ncbi:hypothetical protein WDH52_00080 [Streptomyces sp. TRM70308]|uniref:WXG100 family type VII secretion target n=1 Tax=Streptomyces sp. TRM70308 TaxID=3131932 RepID=UPI003D05D9DB
MSEEYTDEEIVAGLSNYIEARRVIQSLPFVPGGPSLGQTDWENRRLNDMVDMIDSARPSDLQAVGDALKEAADAISDIGDEITKYSRDVEWEGRAAEAFKDWALNLGKNTSKLGTYTDYAGTQLQVAAEGLASVKSSMPPRDPDAGPGLPLDEVPAPARVEGNERWTAAQKKEKDRQEAINQMNRLSSYYKVTRDLMASQDEPTFGPMPNIGVPTPPPTRPPALDQPAHEGAESYQPSAAYGAGTGTPPRGADPSASFRQPLSMDAQYGGPGQSVGTHLNSVSVPTAPAADSGARPPAPNPGPTTVSPVTPTGPPGPVSPTPTPRGSLRNAGNSIPPKQNPVPRPGPPVNRPTTGTSQHPGNGNRASALPSGQGPVGRPPLMSAPPGNGRHDGVTGGRPQRQVGQPATGTPRIPQATVVGGDHAPMGRAPLGGPGATGPRGDAGGTPVDRRVAAERGGVVGTPRADGPRADRRGAAFTPGGTGLVQGRPPVVGPQGFAAPRTSARAEQSRSESERPEYLCEDEATWTPRRDVVPQVID